MVLLLFLLENHQSLLLDKLQKRWWQKHIGMFLKMTDEQFRNSLQILSPFQAAISNIAS